MQQVNATSHSTRKELRVTRIVLAMLAAFLAVWTPYALAAVAVVSGVAGAALESPLAVAPLVMAKLSTCTTPVLYILLNPQVRRKGGQDTA